MLLSIFTFHLKNFYETYQNIFCSLCWFPRSKVREFHPPNCYDFILGLIEKQSSCLCSNSS